MERHRSPFRKSSSNGRSVNTRYYASTQTCSLATTTHHRDRPAEISQVGDKRQAQRWYAALERPRRRASTRCTCRGAGPPGAIPISTEQSVTIGFCQEWLSWPSAFLIKSVD